MFAGTKRSGQILSRVRSLLGQISDTDPATDMVFALATQRQIELAEEYLCVESHATLPVIANTESYDLTSLDGGTTQSGFFRLKLLAAPSTDLTIIRELDVAEFDFQKRFGRLSVGLPLRYVKIFENTISFLPIPTASGSWTIYYYKSPTTTISSTVAPETPSPFDSVIAYGVAAELAAAKGNDKLASALIDLYETKKEQAMSTYQGGRTESNTVTYNDL